MKLKGRLQQLLVDGALDKNAYNLVLEDIENHLDEKIKKTEKENNDAMTKQIQLIINEMFPNGYELAS